MTIQQLKNPPVREAIISVSFKDSIDDDKVSNFSQSKYISSNYDFNNHLFKLNITDSPKSKDFTAEKNIEGILFKCKKNTNLTIQLKLGQLSFHNINNYIGWDEFYKEFKSIWLACCESIGKVDLTRISIRYINLMDFDLNDNHDDSVYLNIGTVLPKKLTELKIKQQFSQNTLEDKDGSIGLITFINTEKNKRKEYILDINVLKENNFICNSDDMWSSFDSLREFKNLLFFECITSKTKSNYE